MDDRVRQEIRIGKIAPGDEEEVLSEALDRVEPGDLVVYHRGMIGTASPAVKRAAMRLHVFGRCLLTQRITGERTGNGERIVDYLAIKAKVKP